MNFPQYSIVLKGFRGRECMTQDQLAKEMGMSRSTISRIETGKRKISSAEAKKLAKILNTKSKMFEK